MINKILFRFVCGWDEWKSCVLLIYMPHSSLSLSESGQLRIYYYIIRGAQYKYNTQTGTRQSQSLRLKRRKNEIMRSGGILEKCAAREFF